MKAMSYKTRMHGGGESYSGIVPAKRSNEGQGGPQEIVEGRPLAKEIRRRRPELDTEPAEPGALHRRRNASTEVRRGVIIQGRNRVR